MGAVTGTVVFFLIWWTVLFAVLPWGVRPDAEADLASGGWRGAPVQPRLLFKAAWTTAISAVLWLGIELLVRSDWLSFRSGWLALPEN